jgi:hypothetical protein
MRFKEFQQVALAKDIPESNLRRRDLATIVDMHPANGGEVGYSIEVFNARLNMKSVEGQFPKPSLARKSESFGMSRGRNGTGWFFNRDKASFDIFCPRDESLEASDNFGLVTRARRQRRRLLTGGSRIECIGR